MYKKDRITTKLDLFQECKVGNSWKSIIVLQCMNRIKRKLWHQNCLWTLPVPHAVSSPPTGSCWCGALCPGCGAFSTTCSPQSLGVSVPLPRSPLTAGAQRPSLAPALRAVPPLTWVELTVQGFLRRRSWGQCFPSDRPAGLTAGGRDALWSPSPAGDAMGEGPECLWLHPHPGASAQPCCVCAFVSRVLFNTCSWLRISARLTASSLWLTPGGAHLTPGFSPRLITAFLSVDTRPRFSSVPGGHFKPQDHQQKAPKCKTGPWIDPDKDCCL